MLGALSCSQPDANASFVEPLRLITETSRRFPTLGKVAVTAYLLSDDPDTQVSQTGFIMDQLAHRDASHPEVLDLLRMIRPVEHSQLAICAAIHHWVHHSIRFVEDSRYEDAMGPEGEVIESVMAPSDLLFYREGDCDDFSTLIRSMLLAARVPNRFVTVAALRKAPGEFSHVYNAAYVDGGRRVSLDGAFGDYCGWEVEDGVTRKQEWGELR